MPETVIPWSATSLPEKLIKIGVKVVSHGRCVTFQMVEGRGAPADVPANILAYRPIAGAARASVIGRLGQIWYSDLTDHNGKGAP